MTAFQSALQVTLKHEGGFFENPKTGEVVNRGITLKTYRELVDPEATEDTIRNLTDQQTFEFYSTHFWYPLKLEWIRDQTLAAKIFDLGVNMGVGTITRIVQEALNKLGRNVTVDGCMGMQTVVAVNVCDLVKLLKEIRFLAEVHYREIAVADPRHAGDLDGWLKRLES